MAAYTLALEREPLFVVILGLFFVSTGATAMLTRLGSTIIY